MYRLMLYYLLVLFVAAIVLSFLKILPHRPSDILFSGGYLVVVCYLSNKLLAYFFRAKTNLESRSITAFILALIIGPLTLTANFALLTVAGIGAMASKYVLAMKKRHIFNPAAVGVLLATLLLGEGASWWVGNLAMLPFVVIGGLIVVAKIRRFHLIGAFLATYLGLVVLDSLVRGLEAKAIILDLQKVLLISPLLFFSLVMLVEPLTAPQKRRLRFFYGIFIGAILVVYQHFLTFLPYTLELALLSGNLITRLINPDIRLSLILKEKKQIAVNVFSFWFEPLRPLGFVAGQFLEWTLPHSRPDSRGTRRYFTIASSPTETGLMLATRFSPKGSSFKRTLKALAPGEEISVSNREGEFTLPDNPKIPLAFIAGGIGITPFRSIVRYLLDTNQRRDIILLYSLKNQNEIAFREIFDEASQRFGLKPIYHETDTKGFIDEQVIKLTVRDWRDRMFYVSGPEPMVQAFEKMLARMGIKKNKVKRDYFPGYEETHQKA